MKNVKKISGILKILDKIDRISDFDEFAEAIAESEVNKKEKRRTAQHAESRDIKSVDQLNTTLTEPHVHKRRKISPIQSEIPKKLLKDANNPLEALSNDVFSRKYGFSKQTVIDILSMISYGLEKSTNRGQPTNPMTELLLTLEFLKHGGTPTKSIRISQPTISRLIKRVTSLLAELKLRFIKIPERNKFKTISLQFQDIGGCPEVFGCIGSCHVPIKSPGKNIADDFLNEHGFYSFRVLVSLGMGFSLKRQSLNTLLIHFR